MNRIRPARNHPRAGIAPLPKTANDFIYLLAITLKAGTCASYRTSLRKFHAFLDSQNCSLKRVTRRHLTSWFAALHARGLSRTTRSQDVTCVRSYLYWLHEQNLLSVNPNDLIRPSDIPRRPTYLPRPLPPEVDFKLQARLARSNDPLQKGLLLMRNTGIRIGELRALAYQCIHTDLKGNSFLKVPLGKLNNERLVPLDEKTLTLAKELQQQGPVARKFLLETCHAKKINYYHFRRELQRATQGIEISEPITTHRLRHTYATTLLTYGVSLEAIMRLLGHRDFNMTLRYADVTLGSIKKEFFAALAQTQNVYGKSFQSQAKDFDAVRTLSDLIAWLNKARAPANSSVKAQAQLLIRRLTRAKDDLEHLIPNIPGA